MNCLMTDMLALANEKYLQMMELLQLTKEQTAALAAEDVDQLGRNVESKQNIIDRVNFLDAKYQELKAQQLSEENASRIENLKDDSFVRQITDLDVKINRVGKEMMVIDQKNLERGKLLLEKIGATLLHVRKAPGVSQAYRSGMSAAIFINRQG